MKTNNRKYMDRLALSLAVTLLLACSPVVFGDDGSNKSQGSDAHSTDRSASAKSGSGNSSVPNGSMTESGHNGTPASNAGGNAGGSQYSTNNPTSNH